MALLVFLALACNKPRESAAVGATLPTSSPDPKPASPLASANGEAVKAALDKLLDLAQNGECSAMAPLIALSHSDTDDDWKRSMRYDVPNERVKVDKECARLQVLVADLKGHKFQDFSQEDESEGQWNIWTVGLQYNDGNTEIHSFAFLPNGNGYLLGDID